MQTKWMMLVLAAAACGDTDRDGSMDTTVMDTTPETMAAPMTAVLRDSAGRELGTFTLASAGDSGILVTGTARGVAQGRYGLHLHAAGRCEGNFESAGPHWNPANRQHGTDNSAGAHAGDLEMLEAQSDSTAEYDDTSAGGTMQELMDADGTALVLHAGQDDYRTDPDGNSGARVACGVVM